MYEANDEVFVWTAIRYPYNLLCWHFRHVCGLGLFQLPDPFAELVISQEGILSSRAGEESFINDRENPSKIFKSNNWPEWPKAKK